ncbi:hypothetical protein MIND_00125400 [Mycena indigotica]|uniref:F-box domain-containing protein n=1 Tax=Mycena indigotica TaxID=2126181 RepID=A0A8H6WKT5_9AGAR|nr:uncharacterized protein MIND_00125400 [Mycena indigotica]KAF7316074.1 hypothetical protein MIND_00125400 [Mycena indigotica]
MSQNLTFALLPPDVLFSILLYCDVSRVLALSHTCRTLRDITQQPYVWISLARRLQANGILEYDIANLIDLSTDKLIAIVKRTVVGPATWSADDSNLSPVIQRIITIPVDTRPQPGVLHWENDARLVPDARHVIYRDNGRLRCYSVAEKKLTWTFTSQLPTGTRPSVIEFSISVHPHQGGEWIVVIIGERTFPYTSVDDRKNFVTCIALEPASGRQVPLIVVRAPDTEFDNPFSRFAVLGTAGVAVVNTSQGTHLLLDWQRKQVILIQHPSRSGRIGLIADHALIKTSFRGAEVLCIVPLAEIFDKHGTPAPDPELVHDRPISAASRCMVDALVYSVRFSLEVITHAPSPPSGASDEISVCQSPLRDDTWRVWIYVRSDVDKTLPASSKSEKMTHLLCCYDITLHTNDSVQACTIRRRLRAPAARLYIRMSQGISFSGHAQIFDAVGQRCQFIVPAPIPFSNRPRFEIPRPDQSSTPQSDLGSSSASAKNNGKVSLEGCGDNVYISPYSGALVYSTALNVQVVYYL